MRLRRIAVRAVIATACVLMAPQLVRSYALQHYPWPNGNVVMQLHLGSSGTLVDGSSSWDAAAARALGTWNQDLARVHFQAVQGSTESVGTPNGVNDVYWASSLYGKPLDDYRSPTQSGQIIALTLSWRVGGSRVESDVIFNNKASWNSYPGPLRGTLNDFYRVALHEFGHVLGLDHPNDAGQQVVAQMNSTENDLDSLAADDIAGGVALYGSSRVASTSLSPPGAPAALTASAVGSSLTLSWNAPTAGAPSAYIVEAGSSSGSANLANVSTGNTATTFSAREVEPGTYYIRVRATNSAGTSGPSNEVVLSIGGSCTGPPNAPNGLRVASNSGGTVVLTWNAAAGAPATYIIEAGSAPGATNLANIDLGGLSTSLTSASVARGTYYVRVRAKNACAIGGASNEIVLTVG